MKNKKSSILLNHQFMTWKTRGAVTQLQITNESLLKRLETKIKNGVGALDYQTNVNAQMTPWDFFKSDEDFQTLLSNYFFICGKGGIYAKDYDGKTGHYRILVQNAWGNLMKKGDFVFNHHHLGSEFSSVLYFDSHASLDTDVGEFPTKRGLIITLPSYCYHSVKTITKDIQRYTLPWNWSFKKTWDPDDPGETRLKDHEEVTI